MRKLIYEVKTDAILLSYYLEKTYGWTYQKKAPRTLDIRTDGARGNLQIGTVMEMTIF